MWWVFVFFWAINNDNFCSVTQDFSNVIVWVKRNLILRCYVFMIISFASWRKEAPAHMCKYIMQIFSNLTLLTHNSDFSAWFHANSDLNNFVYFVTIENVTVNDTEPDLPSLSTKVTPVNHWIYFGVCVGTVELVTYGFSFRAIIIVTNLPHEEVDLFWAGERTLVQKIAFGQYINGQCNNNSGFAFVKKKK